MSSTGALETFPNPRPERDFEITIAYVPDARCVEMKSLKLYFLSFRNKGIFYEAVTNQILDDLVAILEPRRMTVIGDFAVRGGTAGSVTVNYESPPKKGRNGRKGR